jgi:DNA polymerase III delta prime subunit
MDLLWVNKHQPSCVEEIIGHKEEIHQISKWLNSFKNSEYSSIFISGNHGIGKTLTVQLILKQFNYKVNIINPNDIKDYRGDDNIDDFFETSESIESKIKIKNHNFSNRTAIIFDNAESISLTSEKKYILDIFKENNKKKVFPIIFISNGNHSKLLSDISKQSLNIKFNTPPSEDIVKFMKSICKKEKILIQNMSSALELINFSQNDIRRLINLLQELSIQFNGKIEKEDIYNFITNSKEKKIDVSLYEATSLLLNQDLDHETVLKLYQTEKVLLPLMIHENYLKKIKKVDDVEKTLYKMVKISDSLSRADNIETSIYTDQSWYLQNIHGFYSCMNTNYWVNENSNINISNLEFSKDLNKTSLKNINKKNINNLHKIIGKKSIEDLLIINRLNNNLFNDKKYIDIINTLKHYKKDLDIKDIELTIKIDKSYPFKLLTTKEKKIVEALI